MKNNPFKVGDIITGTPESDDNYAVTNTAMIEGLVTDVSRYGELSVKVMKHLRHTTKETSYVVYCKYFKLAIKEVNFKIVIK